MQNKKLLGFGLLLSWVIFQFCYRPCLQFLIHTPTYAFMRGWDDGTHASLTTSNLYLVFSGWIFSLAIGFFLITTFFDCMASERFAVVKNKLLSVGFLNRKMK